LPSLYRIFPYLPGAQLEEPGGALYLPPQRAGRLDNPELYSILYLSSAAPGAVAEAFGRFPEWTSAMVAGSPSLPGSIRAVASYQLAAGAEVCDLDDPQILLQFGLRPSDVVSRDYDRTRAWARRIFEEGSWAGIRWWSYYDPRWASIGLWDTRFLTLDEVRPLRLDDPAVVEAGRIILRRIRA
jgi:hypothetical protein